MAAPTLTDGVVTLRAHRPEDVPRIVEQCRDPGRSRGHRARAVRDSDAEEFVAMRAALGPKARSGRSPWSSRAGTPAPCRCATRARAVRDRLSGRTRTSAAPGDAERAAPAGRVGLHRAGPPDDRVAGVHRQLGQPEAGVAARGHGRGHPAPLPPAARGPARRLDRHAAEGRPARAALDVAGGAGADRRRVPAAGGPRRRRPAHPRGHRGTGHRALARPQAGAVHARRRAAPTSSGAGSSPRPESA